MSCSSYYYHTPLDDGVKSLATVELRPTGAGTELVLTEPGAFLDGNDGLADRERGTAGLLDELGKWLDSRAP